MKKLIISLFGLGVLQLGAASLEAAARESRTARMERLRAARGLSVVPRSVPPIDEDEMMLVRATQSLSLKRERGEEADHEIMPAGERTEQTPSPVALIQRRAVGGADGITPTAAAVTPEMLTQLNAQFLKAAAEGNLAAIRLMLTLQRAAIDFEARDEAERTALHLATVGGHENIVRMLLACGARLESRDHEGNTPLLLAVKENQSEAAEVLVAAGANIFAINQEGFELTPAKVKAIRPVLVGWDLVKGGARASMLRVVHHGLEVALKGAARKNFWVAPYETFWAPFYQAAQEGDLATLMELLPEGEDNSNACLFTALLASSIAGYPVIINSLIKVGAKVDERSYHGWTALYAAAWAGQEESIRMLLAHGADVNVRATGGSTPLHMAVRYGLPATVDVLLQHGAETQVDTIAGECPLDWAKKAGLNQIIALLEAADECAICRDPIEGGRGNFATCLRAANPHKYHRECIRNARQYGHLQCPKCAHEALTLTSRK